jgi:hypothetical protein
VVEVDGASVVAADATVSFKALSSASSVFEFAIVPLSSAASDIRRAVDRQQVVLVARKSLGLQALKHMPSGTSPRLFPAHATVTAGVN